MRKETFAAGLAVLESAFNRKFNRPIYWKFLRDLKDRYFLETVQEVVLTVRELFPNTNLIAIIRDKEVEVRKRIIEKEQSDRLQITDQRESVPPPKEWAELMKKLKKGGLGGIPTVEKSKKRS